MPAGQLTQKEEKWVGFMYYRQKNKTALRSQYMIVDALFILMGRKPFQSITITEICEEAAIGRKTFYRNFETREDVIDLRLDLLLEKYREAVKEHEAEERLHLHFQFIHRHSDLLILLYRNGMIEAVNRKFSVLIPEAVPVFSEDPVKQEYLLQFVTLGLEGIEEVWIRRGFQESIEEIVEMAKKLLREGIGI